MRLKKMDNNRIIYIFIAILCLLNFFLGVKVIRKAANNKETTDIKYKAEVEEIAVPVFSNTSDDSHLNTEAVDLTINDDNKQEDNFYIRLFSSSNIYMKRVYDVQVEKDNLMNFNRLWSKVSIFFEPKTYFKSQFPAIFKMFDATAVSGNNAEFIENGNEDEGEENEAIVLEDIVFIEDPIEHNEGEEQLGTDDNEQIASNTTQTPNSINLDHENPYILIYHTHGTEAYLPIKTGRFHTDKREYNVITIGEIIGKVLSEKGHKLKHVDIYHDIPSYNESYARSLATAKDELSKNKNIKLVFDVHRDGIEENASYIERAKKDSKVTINSKEVATFSMVIGPQNPNKDELIKFAKYIKSVSDKMYPGLCKGIIIKPYGKFNQYLSDYYTLLEVGSNLNTIDEAKESAKLIGEVLNEVINGIQDNQ
ncbi:stage II sporulation protein P [Brassicibacter mesophilus]|uniref:stage II sporulation protein P n=1 Tax=Brassicibacter mesophilus TaxID=745119 RepID=UPI003D225132